MTAFLDTIRNALSLTAWEMEIPKAYGVFHLSVMIIGFALCGFFAWKLRKLSDRANKIMILSIGILLAVSEVYKQLMYELVLEPGGGYRWGDFPFQMCSVPMYFCLIIPFLKPGRVQRAMYNFIMTYNLMGGFVAFFEPSGLLHDHVTLTAHALIWHLLLVFLGAYVALSHRGGTQNSDFKDATVTFGILALIAFAFNCAFYEISDHSLNNFFIGPANSSIIVFKQISETFGWVVSTVIYLPCVCFASYVIMRFFRLINDKFNKPDSSKESEIPNTATEKVLVHK